VPSLLELQREFARELPAVYRGNIHANRTKALACAYPVVRKIVGGEFFEALAARYALACPTRNGDLNEYGERLPQFLADFAPAQGLPYLPDVARMEWLAHRAHFAADAGPFDAGSLENGRGENLCVRLAPACALLESRWPLGRLWDLHQDDYEGAFEVDLDAGPDRNRVHRPHWRAQVLSLAPGDFAFLEAAARGETLGAALEAGLAAEWLFDVPRALARWIDARVVVALA
jgi:hypothetical protein